jgi:hypothetical protein
MSLVIPDRLWGMISRHSRSARCLPQNVPLECESISQLFSWQLYAKEEEPKLQGAEDWTVCVTLSQTGATIRPSNAKWRRVSPVNWSIRWMQTVAAVSGQGQRLVACSGHPRRRVPLESPTG